MFRKLTMIVAPLIAIGALTLADTPAANAQGFSLRIGNYGSSFGAHYGGFSSRSFGYGVPTYRGYSSYRSYSPSYGYTSRYRNYHPSRPHIDYYPTQVYRHGNHYDVVPGHYHRHHGGHHH
ncbi:hypothetical protein [Rhodopirellula sp. MGV]|uniref:hypothetical protein n=1 Tax=Rhodopirellula sp. MGV TaxID=2023130 RepID=UPI000B963DDA|nr:hypothetical protein [Rhodopirellula sp. MGV]OYP31690.1 hypothetical protein CGZ80_20550 [Rhodopirellula sp. MGV]PNY33991.1 hypothetical protein C2E31_25495 [Rhodopirellula baltica]